MLLYLIFTAAGFLLGSVMFGYLLPRLIRGIDVTALSPDGNPGTFNSFKYAGIPVGILCLIGDVGKGFAPVFIAAYFVDIRNLMFAAVIAAPVLGHALSPFFLCGGGKAIATSFGVLLGLIPYSWVVFILAFIYIFFSVLIVIDPHEKRSVVTFCIFAGVVAALTVFTGKFSVALGCLAVSAVAVLRNRALPAADAGRRREGTAEN